jgi:hypothetical protein
MDYLGDGVGRWLSSRDGFWWMVAICDLMYQGDGVCLKREVWKNRVVYQDLGVK